jgi:LacI family transcriptional regulator
MAVRLKELAHTLGLSPTTVSRALNGYPEVSEKTRARVVAAARAHAYRPSSFAKRLATGRAKAIGHVLPLARHMSIDPHFSDFIAGAGEAYAAAGYDMLISVISQASEFEHYRGMASAGNVDGVIVHAPKIVEPRIKLLQELELPFIVHGRADEPAAGYDWLDVNNRRCFVRATNFLTDLGHRRIALLNGLEELHFAWRRRAGYLDALKERAIPPDPAIMFSGEMSEPNGHAWAMQLLASANPPTAFLASSVLLAMGALRAVQEAGLKPGRDISIVTYDDRLSFLDNAGPVPIFTATRSSIRNAGKRCAELLIGRIEDPFGEPAGELWEAELVVGASTGPAPR